MISHGIHMFSYNQCLACPSLPLTSAMNNYDDAGREPWYHHYQHGWPFTIILLLFATGTPIIIIIYIRIISNYIYNLYALLVASLSFCLHTSTVMRCTRTTTRARKAHGFIVTSLTFSRSSLGFIFVLITGSNYQ